jgi:hypothetical protein
MMAITTGNTPAALGGRLTPFEKHKETIEDLRWRRHRQLDSHQEHRQALGRAMASKTRQDVFSHKPTFAED